jgi:hypothetical protein
VTDTPTTHAPLDAHDEWMKIARAFREALKIVRPGEYTQCLPGEPAACGGDAAYHTLASGALIGAIALHHAEHAGPEAVTSFWDYFDSHRSTLGRHQDTECTCERLPSGT